MLISTELIARQFHQRSRASEALKRGHQRRAFLMIHRGGYRTIILPTGDHQAQG